MWNFIFGFALAGIAIPLSFGLIYVNTKSYKAKDTAFMRYIKMDRLWSKTITGKLTFSYSDTLVNVFVKSNSLRGTNRDVVIYDAYINDIHCATCVKMFDAENLHYGFYIDNEFDDKEVWDILNTAYLRTQEDAKKEKKQKGQTRKKSILKETNNESV